MRTKKVEVWVVYWSPVKGTPAGMRAVCEQTEWDQMAADRPGFHTLIRAGITNEGEAERLARGKSGDPVLRGTKAIMAAPPISLTPPVAAA